MADERDEHHRGLHDRMSGLRTLCQGRVEDRGEDAARVRWRNSRMYDSTSGEDAREVVVTSHGPAPKLTSGFAARRVEHEHQHAARQRRIESRSDEAEVGMAHAGSSIGSLRPGSRTAPR